MSILMLIVEVSVEEEDIGDDVDEGGEVGGENEKDELLFMVDSFGDYSFEEGR